MSTQHPSYPGLTVYVGTVGEAPHAGAFYMAKPGDTLTKVAVAAYGAVDRPLYMASMINRSKHNLDLARAGKILYRTNSSDCNSPTLKKAFPDEFKKFGYNFVHTFKNGVTRPLTADKAWIALCQRNGSLPTIWIPTVDGKEPEQLIDGEGPKTLPTIPKVPIPAIRTLFPPDKQLPVTPDVVLPPAGGGGTNGGGGGGGDKPRFHKAGVPSWLGWAVLAGLSGGLVYWYRTAKS